MQWVRANSTDFGGPLPQPRSGHSAVNVGKSLVVVFGGLVDKRFISDVAVYDVANRLWFAPHCTGNESDGQVGPSPRAFHVAAAIGCHMFVFGGRYASKRLGDFWMLDTEIWQWSQLTCFGELPSPRDFAAASVAGNQKLVMYGGWDGKKWLSDVYVLDTISLEWMELSLSGAMPPPRCGHTASMVEKRLLVFGGRGGGGPIMGDLWALKGLYEGENESPGWTQLKLPGQSPSPRCGHTVTSGGLYLLLFGGHGTGGWLSRYDIYHNDCIILDRVSAQWKRLATNNELPPARAYHSMTSVGSRYMLFGGFDGKSTFGDIWWLVPEDDPIARRSFPVTPLVSSNESKDASVPAGTQYIRRQEEFSLSELVKKLGTSVSAATTEVAMVDELNDREFLELCSRIAGEPASTNYQAVREHWKTCEARALQLKELGPLFRDYQRLITRKLCGSSNCLLQFAESQPTYQYYHMQSASQLRMADVEKLLSEYRQLLSS